MFALWKGRSPKLPNPIRGREAAAQEDRRAAKVNPAPPSGFLDRFPDFPMISTRRDNDDVGLVWWFDVLVLAIEIDATIWPCRHRQPGAHPLVQGSTARAQAPRHGPVPDRG
jgi:hypothetical protein